MLENTFSSGLRVTILNDFLKPEETCTKPAINYTKPQQKLPEESTSNSMMIEYDNPEKPEDNSMTVEPTQIAKISLADCLACSGCITSSEVIFLESQSISEFSKHFNQNKTVVVSINQQAVSSLAVYYQLTPEQTFSKLRTFFKGIGVNYVFSLSSMRDISLIEVAKEFVEKKKKSFNDKNVMPMLLGYCPGWVCYAEKAGDASVLDHISTAKSSQQLMGNYLKNSFCKQLNIDPASIYHVCVSQCYDKKLEAVRDSISSPSEEAIAEVDIVLSTTEVVDLINEHKVNFVELAETLEVGPHAESTRISDAQLGPSHGFVDMALKFAAKEFWGMDVDLTKIVYNKGRNNEIWETELSVNGQVVLTMARAYGFRNIQNIMRSVKRNTCKYDFVELLACPGGCTNGGGQIKASPTQNVKELLNLVNEAYNSQTTPVQDPLNNPFVADYYTNVLPEEDDQKKQLHTSYKVLQPVTSSHLASSKITW